MSSNNKYFNKLLKFNNSKKAVSGVVALTVFLVITVISVLGFQTWYTSYGGQIESNLHEEAEKIPTISVLSSNEDIFYLRNNKKTKIDIIKFVINGYDCGNGGSYNPGIFEMDMNCDYALDREKSELLIITTTGVYSHKFFVDEVFSCDIGTAEGYAGGVGSIADPIEICDCDMLQNIKNYTNTFQSYELINDIDCSETINWNLGLGFEPMDVPGFPIYFYGNGNSIRNLYINRPLEDNVGIFGEILLLPIFNDISLIDLNITGNNFVGGLAGETSRLGDFNNIFVTGEINGDSNVGGILGYNQDTEINNSYTTATVNGNNNVGSISGNSDGGPSWTAEYKLIFSSSVVTGNSNVGGAMGSGITTIGECDNFYWNNMSTNPNIAVGDGDSCRSGSITTIQDDESYFYGNTNEPMASWDEEVWSFAPDRLPKLKEQN